MANLYNALSLPPVRSYPYTLNEAYLIQPYCQPGKYSAEVIAQN